MQRILVLTALFAAAPIVQLDDATSAILRALQLPAWVTEARQAGVTEAAVRDVIDGLRRRGLPADEAALAVREEVDAVHAGAPKDDFGEFVRRHLDAGLRGRALAEAIRAEHRARGIGLPQGRQPQEQDTTRARGRRP